MSKRLQVILQEADYRQIQHCAQAGQLTVAEWVRRALVAAQREGPTGEAGRKLGALRDAAQLGFPTADIRRMLAQIEWGYRGTGA